MRAARPSSTAISSQGLPSFLWVLLLLLMYGTSHAQTPNNARSGEFFLMGANGNSRPALHQQTDVTMDISGMTARVNVSQSFTNDTAQWQEGVYVFPLPEDSAVNAMRMLVGNREVIGEIREREEAKRVYEQARNEGRRAALTEQQRPNLFTQKLANIGPGETITVELHYIQAVHYEDGRFHLRFPMTLTPRYNPGVPLDALDPNAGFASGNTLSMTVRIDAGLKLARAGSPTHDMAVASLAGSGGKVVMQLRSGRTRMDRDFELEWAPEAADAPQAAVFVDPRAEGTFMQVMLLPPRVEAPVTMLGREVIIVLDSSGSMAGQSMAQAKQSVQLALGRLRDEDYFNVIDFDSTFHTLFPASQPATASNIEQGRAFVEALLAEAGTDMLPALRFALTEPPAVVNGQDLLKQIVFVTDGAVGNEAALFALINASLDDARLFPVGIGPAPNSYFMRKAAETGRGTYTYVNDTARVTELMGALLRKLENAVMADLSVEWPAGVAAEYYPEKIPDLYLGEPVFVTARLDGKVPARQKLVVSGTVAGKTWQRELGIDPANNTSTAGDPVSMSSLASYWARQKIESLLNSVFEANAADPIFKEKLRQDVLAVALPYQLMSPYTSFVAVENVIARPPQATLDTSAIANEEPADLAAAAQAQLVQMAQQQVQFPRTATAAHAWLLAGSLMLLCAALASLSLRREKEYARVQA